MPPARLLLQALVVAALVGTAAAGCERSASSERRPLVVFAAASLTDAFQEFEAAFEARHPALDVQLTFGGSQALRLQIEQGAPAHVFASANLDHIDALVAAGHVRRVRPLTHNRLVVAVPADNPAALRTFADLPRAQRLVVGAAAVPVGRYTAAMLDRAAADPGHGADFVRAVRERIVSEENNVRLARAKVELGEADAAILYRSDVVNAARITAVPIPPALDVPVAYGIGAIGADPGAEAWITFALGPEGQRLLERHGFGR